MAHTHFADASTGFTAICEEGGPVSETHYDCRECITLLRIRRKTRRIVEAAQDAARVLQKKKKRRIKRAEERRLGSRRLA